MVHASLALTPNALRSQLLPTLQSLLFQMTACCACCACCREHGDLFRLVACSPEDAYAFDLDRTAQRAACTAPAVQLVLQYSMLVARQGSADGSGKAAAPGSRWVQRCCLALALLLAATPCPIDPHISVLSCCCPARVCFAWCLRCRRFVLQRRMRIITAALPLATGPAQLFASCDGEATACLVVHKCLATAAEQGAAAARQMLFDWLVLLAARVAELGEGSGKVGRLPAESGGVCLGQGRLGCLLLMGWGSSVITGQVASGLRPLLSPCSGPARR